MATFDGNSIGATAIFKQPSGYFVSHKYWYSERQAAIGEYRKIPLTLTDSELGEHIIDALNSLSLSRQGGTVRGSRGRKLLEDHPDLEDWSELYPSVGIDFNDHFDKINFELDARAPGLKSPLECKLPLTSSAEQIGACVRQLFAKLESSSRPPVKKKTVSRSSKR